MFSSSGINFIDVKGIPRIVRECPINMFGDLRQYYGIFWELILENDPYMDKDFTQLILDIPDLSNVCIEILKIVKVDVKWCSIDILGYLLFSYVDKDSQPHKGYLWEKYFEKPVSDQTVGDPKTFEEYRALALAALAESEGIVNAIKVLDLMSFDELEEFFKQRAEIHKTASEDPKVKEIEEAKKKYIEKFGSLKSFNEVPNIDNAIPLI
jgi:hypothetical protein